MADLNVQPKKKSIIPWILLILGILALLFFLIRGCNTNTTGTTVANTDSTATTTAATAPADSSDKWNNIDFNAPAVSYNEITGSDINVRGNNNYAIYGLGENILFDEGKSTIRPDAEGNMKQIAASITQRYNGGDVRIYGYTDSTGSASSNKELAQKRAEAVSDWLVSNGHISKNNISINAVGESNPVASNGSSEGRQQNRRVEIVAKKS